MTSLSFGHFSGLILCKCLVAEYLCCAYWFSLHTFNIKPKEIACGRYRVVVFILNKTACSLSVKLHTSSSSVSRSCHTFPT